MNEQSDEALGRDPMRWAMLAGVWALYFCFGLTVSALAPLVAPIIRDLGMSHTEMGSVLGAWQLVYIVSAIPCGIVVDWLKPRRALFVAALLMAASGYARSISDEFLTLFLAVCLFGLGGPMVSTGAPKVVSQWFRGKERGLAMGIYLSGPFAGGAVTLAFTNAWLMPAFDYEWRQIVQLWAACTLAAGMLWWVLCLFPKAREKEQLIDGQTHVPTIRGMRELTSERATQIILVMAVCIFMINHGFNNWLPEILRTGSLDAAAAGYYATLPTVVAVVASLLIPRLAVPGRRLWLLGGLAVCSGLGCLALLLEPGPAMVMGLILQGVARGATMAIALLVLIEMPFVGEKRVGTASGLFFAAAEIGGMGGPLTLGVLYDITGSFVAGLLALTSFSIVILGCAIALRPFARAA